MIQFILMLLGLAFSHNNASSAACHNTQDPIITIQNDGPSDPGTGTGEGGDDGGTGGNTGQTPPPFTNP